MRSLVRNLFFAGVELREIRSFPPATMLEEQQNSSEIQPAASATSVPTTRKASNRYVSRSVREFVKWAPSGTAGIPFLSFLLQQHWAQALLVSKQPEGILQVDLCAVADATFYR